MSYLFLFGNYYQGVSEQLFRNVYRIFVIAFFPKLKQTRTNTLKTLLLEYTQTLVDKRRMYDSPGMVIAGNYVNCIVVVNR